jgi:hypothetical protein
VKKCDGIFYEQTIEQMTRNYFWKHKIGNFSKKALKKVQKPSEKASKIALRRV